MNQETFTYSLLQYRHSQMLGEVLNIGLLVYFPVSNEFRFLYPEKLIRLKFAYPNVPVKTIRSYFKFFEQKANELSNSPAPFHNLKDSFQTFIHKEFLAADASALLFDKPKVSVLYSPDLDLICSQLYNLYFSVFEFQHTGKSKIDEGVLLKKYKKLIEEYAHGDDPFNIGELPKLKYDYVIEPRQDSKLKFEVAWQGKTDLHLVKPISFDLVRSESITRKAYQYYGQFSDLEEYASDQKYLFDVILAKPDSKSLFQAYDNAIRLLEKPKRVKLIEFDELNSYSKETVAVALL